MLGVWGQRVKPDWHCDWGQVRWIHFLEGLGLSSKSKIKSLENGRASTAQRSQHLWSNNNPSYTWRQVLHFPPAGSSHSALPKCSVLPIFKSLELLNALLFTHFSRSQWVIYSMTWPLASKGDGFKSILARLKRETKRSRTNYTSLLRFTAPSKANKNCPVGKSVFSWYVNWSSQQMSLLVY